MTAGDPPSDLPEGLRIVTWSPDGSFQAIVEASYRPELGDRIRADDRVRGLQFSPGHALTCDVSFLPSLPQLRRFSIGLGRRCDVSAVSECPWLESVIVGACPGTIDPSAMTALRHLYVEGPGHEAAVLAATQLEELIWRETSLTDLRGLSGHSRLRQLSLSGGKLASTSGLASLRSLEILGLSRLRSLAEIVEVGVVPTLRVLSVDGVNVAPTMDDVGRLVRLERLELDIAVEVPSVTPLAACASLRRISLQGMRIADGRIAFLADLPDIEDAYVSPARDCDVTNDELRRRVAARR